MFPTQNQIIAPRITCPLYEEKNAMMFCLQGKTERWPGVWCRPISFLVNPLVMVVTSLTES